MTRLLKKEALKRLCTPEGTLNALAIDQRGALRRMLGEDVSLEAMAKFKVLVSKALSGQVSSMLLDPEVGFPAADASAESCGIIMAYEKTGYDKTAPGRYPDLIDDVSVYNLKERGADAIKLLLYYDVDEGDAVNVRKHAFVERVGMECHAAGLPFFLEIVTYDHKTEDTVEFAKVKPHKVNTAMKIFSDPRYQVDVLKVEVPVNMAYVEGYTKEGVAPVYSRAQALAHFKAQSDATDLPFIFLSAGVSAEFFRETLRFAQEAGNKFCGVLCGRATWAKATEIYKTEGEEAARQWLETEGAENVRALNECIAQVATPLSF